MSSWLIYSANRVNLSFCLFTAKMYLICLSLLVMLFTVSSVYGTYDICHGTRCCNNGGTCVEGSSRPQCACRRGFFGEFCDYTNTGVSVHNYCDNINGATVVSCENEGVCIAYGTVSACACLNTEFTGEMCQFNRTCQSICLDTQQDKQGRDFCPVGETRFFESCLDNGLQPSPTEETVTYPVTTQPEVTSFSTPTADVTMIAVNGTDTMMSEEFVVIIISVLVVFLLVIVALSISLLFVVFFVLRSMKRKRPKSRYMSRRLDPEQSVSTPISNGNLHSILPLRIPVDHYDTSRNYSSPPQAAQPYEVPEESLQLPPSIQRRNRFPETYCVNNRTYSIHSNISDLYAQVQEFHDNNEATIAPSYAVIVPSASDRASPVGNCVSGIALRKHRTPPPIPPKPSHSSSTYWEPGKDFPSLFDQMHKSRYKEIKTENLKLFNLIGRGEFGDVWRGTLDTPIGEIPIAIKLLKETLGKQENISFLQEAAIIGQFNHVNVLKLIGVVTLSDPKLIISELMEIQLRDYLLDLRKKSHLEFREIAETFLGFSRGISLGMSYLSNKGFIHRDLAARNILLDAQNECKIADFGMTRRLMDSDYYRLKDTAIIPLKWSAPESVFYKKFHSKSDVWSFAMVLFEIWSFGSKPWPFDRMNSVVEKLNQSILLQPPPGCPRDVYLIMVLCWHPEAEKRPSFAELSRMFKDTSIDSLRPPPGNDKSCVLGEELCYGEDLYKDLQWSYRKQRIT